MDPKTPMKGENFETFSHTRGYPDTAGLSNIRFLKLHSSLQFHYLIKQEKDRKKRKWAKSREKGILGEHNRRFKA